MAAFTSSSVGLGLRARSAAQLITNPGVQNPHCMASCSTKAACTGCRWPCFAKPSIVVTSRPRTSIASIMHEQIGFPSIQTVQAQHAPVLQAILVPVRSSGPRSTSASVMRGGICSVREDPFIFSVRNKDSGPIAANPSKFDRGHLCHPERWRFNSHSYGAWACFRIPVLIITSAATRLFAQIAFSRGALGPHNLSCRGRLRVDLHQWSSVHRYATSTLLESSRLATGASSSTAPRLPQDFAAALRLAER